MDAHELEKLIKLSRKTGDTLIIAGTEGQESFVLMPVSRYEGMVFDESSDETQSETVYEESLEQEEYDFERQEIPVLETIVRSEQAASMTPEPPQRSTQESSPQSTVKNQPVPFREPSKTLEKKKENLKNFVDKRRVDESSEERFYLEPID